MATPDAARQEPAPYVCYGACSTEEGGGGQLVCGVEEDLRRREAPAADSASSCRANSHEATQLALARMESNRCTSARVEEEACQVCCPQDENFEISVFDRALAWRERS